MCLCNVEYRIGGRRKKRSRVQSAIRPFFFLLGRGGGKGGGEGRAVSAFASYTFDEAGASQVDGL